MAASLPCKDCASGVLHEGTPAGREETVHGLKTYVTDPPSGAAARGIVVIIPDLFGWTLNNSRVLADRYAERGGYTVYLPDFMDGYVLDPNLLSTLDTFTNAKTPFLHKIFPGLRTMTVLPIAMYNCRAAVCKPRIFNFFSSLRSSTSLPVGAAGFCWGGKYVALLCQDTEKSASGKTLVDCGFTAHPSQLALPADIEAVRLPLCVSNGTLDFQLKPEGNEMIREIFARKEAELNAGGKRGKMFKINVVEGARHGFAVRGNPGDEDEKTRGQMAEDQAVDFFARWLVQHQG